MEYAEKIKAKGLEPRSRWVVIPVRIYNDSLGEQVESADLSLITHEKGAWPRLGFGLAHYTSQVDWEAYKKLHSIPADYFYFSEEDKKKLFEKRGKKYTPDFLLRGQPWKYPAGSPERREALEHWDIRSKIDAEEFQENSEAEVKLLLEFEKKAWKVQGEIREKYKEKEKKLIEDYKKKKQDDKKKVKQ